MIKSIIASFIGAWLFFITLYLSLWVFNERAFWNRPDFKRWAKNKKFD